MIIGFIYVLKTVPAHCMPARQAHRSTPAVIVRKITDSAGRNLLVGARASAGVGAGFGSGTAAVATHLQIFCLYYIRLLGSRYYAACWSSATSLPGIYKVYKYETIFLPFSCSH